jgi:hypothetical protein
MDPGVSNVRAINRKHRTEGMHVGCLINREKRRYMIEHQKQATLSRCAQGFLLLPTFLGRDEKCTNIINF